MAEERTSLEDAAVFSGFLAAHALLGVARGQGLTPIYGFEQPQQGRTMERLLDEPVEVAVKAGEQRLEDNPHGARDGVLIYDGRINLSQGWTDALVVQFRDFARPAEDRVVVAIPYTPAAEGKAFAVHNPKVLQAPQEGRAALFEAFFAGVASHTDGARNWSEHLDDSK